MRCEPYVGRGGKDLRDEFAIAALRRLDLLSSPREGDEQELARRCYRVADAFLEERKKAVKQ